MGLVRKSLQSGEGSPRHYNYRLLVARVAFLRNPHWSLHVDHLVIAYPPMHSLARLNGTQIIFLDDAGHGWAKYRMLNRTPQAMTFVGGGKGLDEITMDTEYVMNATAFAKRHLVLSSTRPSPAAQLYRTRPKGE